MPDNRCRRLAGAVWGSWGEGLAEDHVKRTDLDGDSPRLRPALELTQELIGYSPPPVAARRRLRP